MMSHSAISTPLMAVITVEPPWYWSRIMPPIDRLDVERIAPEHALLDPLVA